MAKIEILIADDHQIVREGIRDILELRSEWTVVGEATNGSQAVEKATKLNADVVIIDLRMPQMNGFEAIRRIRQALPQTEIVVLTVDESERSVRKAISHGVRAYLSKSDAGCDLIAAIEAVSRHEFFFSPRLRQSTDIDEMRAVDEGASRSELSPRQLEVLKLLAEGCATKEVASRLEISTKTAETHRTNLMRRIGAHSLADLVHYAIRKGLVEP